MNNLPRIKVSDINLEPVTEKVLITTIDVFGFMYREGCRYVDVFIGDDDPDYIDEISVKASSLTVTELEKIALKWMEEPVELVKDGLGRSTRRYSQQLI